MHRSLQLALFIILGLCLVSCGESVELPTATIESSNTPTPSETPSPTETTTPIPEPTLPPLVITSSEDLVGVWERKGLGQRFNDDGIFVSYETGIWSCRGRFWFEGDQLYIEDLTPFCSIDEVRNVLGGDLTRG